jgi:hypothetical protein
VRKRFALLQTPRFVESFILDRTLEPALEQFGLDEVTVFDPTCGSGHFLLGAFERLVEHRRRAEPARDARGSPSWRWARCTGRISTRMRWPSRASG